MQHSLVSEQLDVLINLLGAELCSVKNKKGLEYLWQAKQDVWPRHAPVLFPIVGKLRDNRFFFKEKPYELGQHGFARDLNFELITKDERSCTFQLQQNAKNNYPFAFLLQITYTLEESALVTKCRVVNPSEEPIYFSVGAHPGFKCPLLETENFEDYFLEFESSSYQLTELNSGLRKESKWPLDLKNNKLFLSKTLFDKDALVFENNQVNKISLCSGSSDHKIIMECAGWPYFGIWSKKGCEEFVCLEPWYGIADKETSTQNFVKKDGIITLEAQKEFSCSFSITFK